MQSDIYTQRQYPGHPGNGAQAGPFQQPFSNSGSYQPSFFNGPANVGAIPANFNGQPISPGYNSMHAPYPMMGMTMGYGMNPMTLPQGSVFAPAELHNPIFSGGLPFNQASNNLGMGAAVMDSAAHNPELQSGTRTPSKTGLINVLPPIQELPSRDVNRPNMLKQRQGYADKPLRKSRSEPPSPVKPMAHNISPGGTSRGIGGGVIPHGAPSQDAGLSRSSGSRSYQDLPQQKQVPAMFVPPYMQYMPFSSESGYILAPGGAPSSGATTPMWFQQLQAQQPASEPMINPASNNNPPSQEEIDEMMRQSNTYRPSQKRSSSFFAPTSTPPRQALGTRERYDAREQIANGLAAGLNTDYRPYSLDDWRLFKQRDGSRRLPAAFPGTDNEEWEEKRKKMERMHQFASSVRERQLVGGTNTQNKQDHALNNSISQHNSTSPIHSPQHPMLRGHPHIYHHPNPMLAHTVHAREQQTTMSPTQLHAASGWNEDLNRSRRQVTL